MHATAFPATPETILSLSPEEADEFLTRLEQTVPARPALVELPRTGSREAIVFGDSHGDWRSTLEVERKLREGDMPRCLIGLGDYIDRSPADCGEGSVANALYLLSLAARHPDRVFLLQGNHETVRRLGVVPHTLPEEVDSLWGPDEERYHRILGLLERGPVAATTTSGAYLAHGGFPREPLPVPWSAAFDHLDDVRLCEVVWAECSSSRGRRGVAVPWGAEDLTRFLGASGCHIFLRGHDPDLTGRSLFAKRCVTLHTTRIYERAGGVLIARLPLDRSVWSTDEVSLEHLATEGRRFPAVD